MIEDPQAFRVNLICACQNDVAYGYGATLLDARYVAEAAFKRHHGSKAKYTQIVVERVTDDGARYETWSAGLRYEFTRGLGRELIDYADVTDEIYRRERRAVQYPYVFESNNPAKAQALRDALQLVISDATNKKLREAAQRALDDVTKIARVLW